MNESVFIGNNEVLKKKQHKNRVDHLHVIIDSP